MMPLAPASLTEDRAPWSIRDTLIGAALTLVPLFALLLSSSLAGGNAPPAKPLTASQDAATALAVLFQTIVIEGALLIAPIYYARRRAGGDWLRSLGLRGTNVGLALGMVVLGMAGALVFDFAYSALLTALHQNVATNADRLGTLFHYEPLTVEVTLLGSVLIAPICEEILFRGFILPGLRNSLSTAAAVALASVIFAAAHADIGSFAQLLALGAILCVARVATRSLWPCIALHVTNNALTAIIIITLIK